MRTKTKIWLGVGAFAVVQAAGVTMQPGGPVLTLTQAAKAADGSCGWERSSEGRWIYDNNCESGERFINRSRSAGRYYYYNERGERWNERGERWNDRRRYNEQGNRWENGERGYDRWGERG